MSLMVFGAVCVAGGVGAALRFITDGLVRARFRTVFPSGTAFINATGSFLLGVLVGLSLASALPQNWVLILGTGVMGGYTTFSTASVETMRLVQDREYRLALVNGFGVLVAAVLLGLLGILLGSLF